MKIIPALAAALLVAACSTNQTEAPLVPQGEPEPPVASSIDTGIEIAPRRLCYFLDNATLTSGVRLAIGPDLSVSGETYGTIHNQAAGYFSFYRQSHEGTVSSTSMTVTTFTEIENDRQTMRESWNFAPQRLGRDGLVYPAADCDAVDARFDDVSGG